MRERRRRGFGSKFIASSACCQETADERWPLPASSWHKVSSDWALSSMFREIWVKFWYPLFLAVSLVSDSEMLEQYSRLMHSDNWSQTRLPFCGHYRNATENLASKSVSHGHSEKLANVCECNNLCSEIFIPTRGNLSLFWWRLLTSLYF